VFAVLYDMHCGGVGNIIDWMHFLSTRIDCWPREPSTVKLIWSSYITFVSIMHQQNCAQILAAESSSLPGIAETSGVCVWQWVSFTGEMITLVPGVLTVILSVPLPVATSMQDASSKIIFWNWQPALSLCVCVCVRCCFFFLTLLFCTFYCVCVPRVQCDNELIINARGTYCACRLLIKLTKTASPTERMWQCHYFNSVIVSDY